MKKKIISLFTMLCLMLPCFFAVACKDDGDEPKKVKAYTYSVVLKNAKGKIDENSLQTEYDYKKQENVSWTNSEEDYTISVTRNTTLTDSLDVRLLEGFDYSNVSLSVNSKDAVGEVKSGDKTNCEKDAYLVDRLFTYSYENMKKDTEMVVDFSNCEWAKVSVDFSDLYSRGVKSYTVTNDFVSINTELKNSLTEIKTQTVEVDYGSTIAFDCSQKVVFKPEISEDFQSLSYSKYASRYYLGNSGNMIQYFTVKQDGDCVVYNASKDFSKKGTLRILDYFDSDVYSSLDNLISGTALNSEFEKEIYEGVLLRLNVVKGSNLFMELSSEDQAYNYFIVESLDTKMTVGKMVEQKTIPETNRVYLELNIANSDGTEAPAKYLVRRPKADGSYNVNSNYYVVSASSLSDNIRVLNADFVLVGSGNTSNAQPRGRGKNILLGFKKENVVKLEISQTTPDNLTEFTYKNKTVIISTDNYTSENQKGRTVGNINESITPSTTFKDITCFDLTDEFKYYEMSVRYISENILDGVLNLDASDFELYTGEKVYYTTDLSNPASWREMTTDTALSISSNNSGQTIFYYMETNRLDSFLQIQFENQSTGNLEVVSVTNEFRDCFGRSMKGTIEIGDDTIDLSRIRYLDIKPRNYSSDTAKLIREYDKTYHTIDISGLGENVLKVSQSDYLESSFKDVNTLNNFNIKYNGQEIGGTVYYYFDTESNKHLQLKDSSGEVVSISEYVMKTPTTKLQIDGNYVYCLSLIGGYYDEGEVFTIEIIDATYGLTNETGDDSIEIFSGEEMTPEQSTETLVEGVDYYFKGATNKDYVIVDSLTDPVVTNIVIVSELNESEAIFKFTFRFSENVDYVSGTEFKLRIYG